MSIWLIEWYKKRFRFVNLIDLRLLYPFPPFPFLLTWNDTMGYCRYHVVFLLRKIIYDINAICTIRISMLSTVETNAGYYKFTCINTVTIFSVLFFWKSGSIVFFPKYLNFIVHRKEYTSFLFEQEVAVNQKGTSWSWSYGSWSYNYQCNQWLSQLILWVRIQLHTT